MTSIKLFHGTVMSGKTKLLSDFLGLLHPSKYLLIVPNFKYREGTQYIKSRSQGYKEFYPNLLADSKTNLYDCVTKYKTGNSKLTSVFIDEIQFYTRNHIDQLFNLTKDTGISVLCFGLYKNHRNEKWDTVKYLQSRGCISQEMCTKCNYCTEIARTNVRFDANFSAEIIDCVNDDGIEKYLPCCLVCWKGFYDKSNKKEGWLSFIKNLSIFRYIFPNKLNKVGSESHDRKEVLFKGDKVILNKDSNKKLDTGECMEDQKFRVKLEPSFEKYS